MTYIEQFVVIPYVLWYIRGVSVYQIGVSFYKNPTAGGDETALSPLVHCLTYLCPTKQHHTSRLLEYLYRTVESLYPWLATDIYVGQLTAARHDWVAEPHACPMNDNCEKHICAKHHIFASHSVFPMKYRPLFLPPHRGRISYCEGDLNVTLLFPA